MGNDTKRKIQDKNLNKSSVFSDRKQNLTLVIDQTMNGEKYIQDS